MTELYRRLNVLMSGYSIAQKAIRKDIEQKTLLNIVNS
ncbi:hypothetical protein TDB9533_01460 [Thalassocella blandensis]|nr:hypothetical protein TDB9533_01460 [Thalassocella blandensis]